LLKDTIDLKIKIGFVFAISGEKSGGWEKQGGEKRQYIHHTHTNDRLLVIASPWYFSLLGSPKAHK
jgi:hypothetical protein